MTYCIQALRLLRPAKKCICFYVQVVLNPDDNLFDSLRAMGLEVEMEVDNEGESEDNEQEEEEEEEEWASGATAEGGGGAAKAKAEPGAEAAAAAKGGGGGNAIEGLLNALIGSGTGTDTRGKAVARTKVASAAEGGKDKDEKVQGVRVKTLMSMPSQISRNVEFRNLSKRSVQLHWVDFKGVEQKCVSCVSPALSTPLSESSGTCRVRLRSRAACGATALTGCQSLPPAPQLERSRAR